MKTYPTALAAHPFKLELAAMIHVCPFCGARLQRWAHGQEQLEESEHTWSSCLDDNPARPAILLETYTNSSGNTVQIVADGDHDWWIFDVRYEYHEPFWYLRPITAADLFTQMQQTADYYQHLASNSQQSLARLKGLVS